MQNKSQTPVIFKSIHPFCFELLLFDGHAEWMKVHYASTYLLKTVRLINLNPHLQTGKTKLKINKPIMNLSLFPKTNKKTEPRDVKSLKKEEPKQINKSNKAFKT